MKLDITLKITPDMVKSAQVYTDPVLVGHMGTHFDVMDKEFPLDYTRRVGVVFDVSAVEGRDIDVSDIDPDKVGPDMFVAFRTGFMDRVGYGTQPYFKEHPQLSHALIDLLLDKGVSIIGIDFAGIRRGREHTPADQRCADRGVFVIENLCDLDALISVSGPITIHTYPVRYTQMTGLPCRVVAEV